MQRTKSIQYDALGLFAQKCENTTLTSGDIFQLERIQSLNYSIDRKVGAQESLGVFKTNIQNLNLNVGLSFQYLVTNGINEKLIGFSIDPRIGFTQPNKNLLKNFYILVDNFNGEEGIKTIQIGNQSVDSITYQCQYNQLLTADVTTTARNIQIEDGKTNLLSPFMDEKAIQQTNLFSLSSPQSELKGRDIGSLGQVNAIKGQELQIQFKNQPYNFNSVNIESLSISIQLNREQNYRMGDVYPFKKESVKPVVQIDLQVQVLNIEQESYKYFNKERECYDFDIVANPCCPLTNGKIWGKTPESPFGFFIRGAKLVEQSQQVQIGSRLQKTFKFEIPIQEQLQLQRNIFASGNYGQAAIYKDFNINGLVNQGSFVTQFKTGQYQKFNKLFQNEKTFNIGFTGLTMISGLKRYSSQSIPEYQISGVDYFYGFQGATFIPPTYVSTFVGNDINLMPEEQLRYDIYTNPTGYIPYTIYSKDGFNGKVSMDIQVLNNEFKVENTNTGMFLSQQSPMITGLLKVSNQKLNYNYTGVVTPVQLLLQQSGISKQYTIYFNS